MDLKKMNKALQRLCEKYAVTAAGTLSESPESTAGTKLETENGSVALLTWRVERRFVELKKMIDDKTLENVSTLRFAAMSADKSLRQLLCREMDLCEFLGGSPVARSFAVSAGEKIAHAIVTLADGKSASIECIASLPEGTEEMDRHEIIAQRGVGCDRTVDTQVPQSSIYVFTADGEQRFNDTDDELFGFGNEEIAAVRAALAVLRTEGLSEVWNRTDRRLAKVVAATLASDKTRIPAVFGEEDYV